MSAFMQNHPLGLCSTPHAGCQLACLAWPVSLQPKFEAEHMNILVGAKSHLQNMPECQESLY